MLKDRAVKWLAKKRRIFVLDGKVRDYAEEVEYCRLKMLSKRIVNATNIEGGRKNMADKNPSKAEWQPPKDTVAGLELLVGHMGADERVTFSSRICPHGWEVIMHFRGERRFAMCSHANDAEVIAKALNNRNSKQQRE